MLLKDFFYDGQAQTNAEIFSAKQGFEYFIKVAFSNADAIVLNFNCNPAI